MHKRGPDRNFLGHFFIFFGFRVRSKFGNQKKYQRKNPDFRSKPIPGHSLSEISDSGATRTQKIRSVSGDRDVYIHTQLSRYNLGLLQAFMIINHSVSLSLGRTLADWLLVHSTDRLGWTSEDRYVWKSQVSVQMDTTIQHNGLLRLHLKYFLLLVSSNVSNNSFMKYLMDSA